MYEVEEFNLHLNFRFPRTYPAVASPIFTVQQPLSGLSTDQISKLSNAIRTEALEQRGSEMVFQVCS
jgi:eukaryotic translation initiation factor 2-alpha kinase 4